MSTFTGKKELRDVIEREGGPQQFTINLLRHVRGKDPSKLSPRELSALQSIRELGTDGFVQKLRDTFPDDPIEDQLPGGGPTAPPFHEVSGRALQEIGRGAIPAEEREPIRFESLPGGVRQAAEVAANLPGDVAETARNIGGGVTTLAGIGLERPGESARALVSPFVEAPFGTTRAVAEELIVGKAGVRELGERVGEEGAGAAFSGRPVTSVLEAIGPIAGLAVGVGGVSKASRLRQFATLKKALKAASVARRVDLSSDVVSVAAEITSKLHNRVPKLGGGGSTVNMRVGNLDGAPLRSVGLFPERTVSIKGSQVSEKQIKAFIEANKDLLSKDGRLSIGSFFDETTGKTDLDVVATLDRKSADFAGKHANQKSIFDLETKDLINTGGTGKMTDDVLRALGPEDGRLDRILAGGVPDSPVPKSIVREAGYDPAISLGGRVAQEAAESPLTRFMNADSGMLGSPLVVENATRLHNLWENFVAFSRPKLFDLAKKDPALADALSAFVSAEALGEVDAVIHFKRLHKIAKSSQKENLFFRLLNHEQGEAIRARNVAQGISEVDVAIPTLSAKELAFVDSDPAMIRMQAYWRSKVVPALEVLAPEAGIDAKTFRSTERKLFASLNPIDLKRGTDALGRKVSNIAGKVQVTRLAGSTFTGPRGLTKKIAHAAKRATGKSEAYSTDGLANLENMFIDRYKAVHQNRLIQKLKGVEVPMDARGRIPEGAKSINIARQEMAVPEDIANAYNSITVGARPFGLENVEALSVMKNAATQIALYGPADATSHFLRLTGALYSQRGVGSSFGAFGRTLANLGVAPLRMAITLGEAFNVHGAAALEDVRTLARLGGVRANFFRLGATREGTLLHKIPTPRKLFFELPKLEGGLLAGRGMLGLETRVRLVTFRMLRKLKPDWDDVRRVSEINNAFGTYVRGLQPELVRVLKGSIGFGDPFAAAGVALLKTQFKALFGADIAGLNLETLWSSMGSAIIMPIAMNAALNDGRLPWEMPDLKPGDIRMPRDDGSFRDFPFRLVGFNVARGVSVIGVREAAISYYHNRGNLQDMMLAMMRSSLNVLLARIGPAERFLGTIATGAVPYINPQSGEFFNKARTSHTQLKDNFLTALAGLLQSPESMLGLDDRNNITPDSTWGKIKETLLEVFGAQPRRRPPEEELTGVGIRRERFKEFKMGSEITLNLRRALDNDEDIDIIDFIEKDMATRGIVPGTEEADRVMGFALRRLRSSIRSIALSEMEAINEDL